MKQKTAFPRLYGLIVLIVLSQFITSCTSKRTLQAKMKDAPTAYGTVATKAPSNLELRMSYIDKYKAIAIREMERTGIPASIKLAQGILESNAGQSTLSSKYNNHFGIKCHSDWQGGRYYQEDDDKDPLTGQLIKSCFRAYNSPEESFIAHSEFLRDPRKAARYGSLFQINRNDYASWAEGLERSGYATAQDYSEKLIRVIEDYQLNRFDNMSSGDLAFNNNPNTNVGPGFENPTGNNNATPPSAPSGSMFKANKDGVWNDTRYVVVNDRSSLEQISGRYDISVKKIQEYNEETPDPAAGLKEGTIVYLQKKRAAFRGETKYHRVKDCETMFDIAQRYGVKLNSLYDKNEMRDGEQPQIGQRILLRRGLFQKWDKPALRDTFGEWRKCLPIDTTTISQPVSQPVNKPISSTTKPNSGEFGFEITPTGQENTSYPSYPSTQPSYPSTQPTYPSTKPNYPSTEVSTYPTEPSYPPYPTTTEPSYPPYPTTKPTTPTKPAPKPVANAQYHTVQQGETLWRLSKQYGVTVDQLKTWNGLPDNTIKPGQQLRIK
jgi:flagellum-specific peptidoglycan hydrolase FlgJ/LysM repeat protein